MRKEIGMLMILILFFSLFSNTKTARAGEIVSGRYLSAAGSLITIRVRVAAPAPAAFIVLQYLPAGVRVAAADPKPAGIDSRTSALKWLFRNPAPGSYSLAIRLSRPVRPKAVRGEIRFRHPVSGKMIRKNITLR